MKSIGYISLFFIIFSIFSQAATRGDVKVIEATENIRYLSQKMVKDYLFYSLYPQKELQVSLQHTLKSLSEDLRDIAITTKDSDTKDILEFLVYSKDQIEEIVKSNVNEENIALMLDYSETLLEGADSIAEAHKYEFSQGEQMLMVAKKINYLLERVMKYYIALHAGYNTTTNQEQMKLAIQNIETNLAIIDNYAYPEDMEGVKNSIDKSWSSSSVYINDVDKLFIPKLMTISTEYMEQLIAKIEIYHSKNQ